MYRRLLAFGLAIVSALSITIPQFVQAQTLPPRIESITDREANTQDKPQYIGGVFSNANLTIRG